MTHTPTREKLNDRICIRCGATIHLRPVGIETFRWVTDPDKPKDSWHCGHDPLFPVQTHSPKPEGEVS